MKKHNTKKGPSYLDLAEYMLSGPFSPHQQPRFRPLEQEVSQVPHLSTTDLHPFASTSGLFGCFFTINSISYAESHPSQSPTLHRDRRRRTKSLPERTAQQSRLIRNRVSRLHARRQCRYGLTQGEEDQEDNEQFQQQGKQQKSMSIIAEQSQQLSNDDKNCREDKNPLVNFEYNPEQYIPNMHLLDIDPLLLRIQHFTQTMSSLKQASLQDQKEFIYLYLTDEDLEVYKDATVEELVAVVEHNLSSIGSISRLQRKARVSRYLQKKKRRIWKKKINYDCRKKVADNRLRVKGKFVTREQACLMLGVELCSQEDLKELLKANYNRMII